MTIVPLLARWDPYRGQKQNLRRKAQEHNEMANRVVAHLNALIANNPEEVQQYSYAVVAHELGLTADEVYSAIRGGGHNAITIKVTAEDRRNLAPFKHRD